MSRHQFEYKKAMDSIHVTPEWEENMINKLMNEGKSTEARIRRAPRIGLVAAAAVACLTIGAGAAEAATGAVSDFFAPLFGSAHTEIIDSIGYPVGVSDSAGGVTVTADAILGDTNGICVIYTLEKEDGTPWGYDEDSFLFEDSTFDFNVERSSTDSWGAHGSSWFIDDDPADNILQFVEQRTVEGGTPHGSAKEILKNLCVWDDSAQETKVLVKGKWTLRFNIDFVDATQSFPAGQQVEFLGEPAAVTGLTFSPISFRVEVEQAKTDYPLKDSNTYLDGTSEALDQQSVVLRLKDGRELDLGYWAGGSVDAGSCEKTVFTKSSLLSEVIPVEEMAAVVVCGTEIPLS